MEKSWEDWTVKTWIEIAKEYGISGYSGKSKKVLITYLQNALKAKGISLEEVQVKLEKKPRSRALKSPARKIPEPKEPELEIEKLPEPELEPVVEEPEREVEILHEEPELLRSLPPLEPIPPPVEIEKGPLQFFTEQDLLLTPLSPARAYFRRTEEHKTALPWGQRKLLLAEMAFFIWFWDPEQVPHPTVVYAGAAPGIHLPFLARSFPEIDTFHLYDPRPFSLSRSNHLHLYSQLFTDEDAKRWSGRDDVLFISDIRTADFTTQTAEENERSIRKDLEMQQRWVEIMQPVQAHLKFRLPYPISEEMLSTSYFYGHVLFQPWAPASSTETRLIPLRSKRGKYRKVVWNNTQYQDQLFYHNSVTREQISYGNPWSRKLDPLDPPELGHDYDSVAEAFILQSYLGKYERTFGKREVLELSREITNFLNLEREREGKSRKTLNTIRKFFFRKEAEKVKTGPTPPAPPKIKPRPKTRKKYVRARK